MENHIKIQTRLGFWDAFSIIQSSATVKGLLFIYIVMFIAFGSRVYQGDIHTFWYKIFEVKEVSGYINSSYPTPYEDAEGGTIYNYFYSFQLDGAMYFGDSYSSNIYSLDQSLIIEYIPALSMFSRIYGTNNAPHDTEALFVAFLLLILFLIVVRKPYKKMKHTKNLLKDAYLIPAHLISSEPYVEIGSNDETSGDAYSVTAMYTITYKYEWEGQIHHTSTDTTERYLFPQETDLLVNASNPEMVVLVNCLPDGVAVRIRKMKKRYVS